MTPDSILMGYGSEGISTAGKRNAVMGRAIEYLWTRSNLGIAEVGR